MGSPFGNSESELMLANLVAMQKKNNPESWEPFTWEEYVNSCTHRVTYQEKKVLDAMTYGGKPVYNTTAYLSEGWLHFNPETKQYSFSEKLLEYIATQV